MKEYQRLSDEDLSNRINATRAYIKRQTKRGEDSKEAESDLCYLERENEYRERAQTIHKSYLAEIRKQRAIERAMMREEEEALREHG